MLHKSNGLSAERKRTNRDFLLGNESCRLSTADSDSGISTAGSGLHGILCKIVIDKQESNF